MPEKMTVLPAGHCGHREPHAQHVTSELACSGETITQYQYRRLADQAKERFTSRGEHAIQVLQLSIRRMREQGWTTTDLQTVRALVAEMEQANASLDTLRELAMRGQADDILLSEKKPEALPDEH